MKLAVAWSFLLVCACAGAAPAEVWIIPKATSTTAAPASMPTTEPGAPGPLDGSGALKGCPCPAPQQYNPVCGTDGLTYNNIQKLKCAVECGRDVAVAKKGSCLPGK